MSQLRSLLKLVGLDLELMATEQKGGKKVRRYAIPTALLDSLMDVVERRDLKYQRDKAEREKPREDRVSRGGFSNLTAAVSSWKANKGQAAKNPGKGDGASAAVTVVQPERHFDPLKFSLNI